MEESTKLIESLLERATEYGKTSYELAKLKVLDKTSDVVSSFIPYFFVFVLFVSFMLFISLGTAFWLNEFFCKTYFGFFMVSAFYGIIGIVIYFFMQKWLKKIIRNFIIKQVLK